jgi:hypothetical protein
MSCFQHVIDKIGLHAHDQNELGWLYSLLKAADGSGSDVDPNQARECYRRLAAAGIANTTLVRVKQMLNSVEIAIGEGR